MAFDVFISFSSIDKHVANAILSKLESYGVKCWIAPRDIPAGGDWSDSIIEAIDCSRIMVLVLSQHSNKSKQVRREVERAINKPVSILPFKIDESLPSKGMAYYMGTLQWLDAATPPLESHIESLCRKIVSILKSSDVSNDNLAMRSVEAVQGINRENDRIKTRKASALVVIGCLVAAGGLFYEFITSQQSQLRPPVWSNLTGVAPPAPASASASFGPTVAPNKPAFNDAGRLARFVRQEPVADISVAEFKSGQSFADVNTLLQAKSEMPIAAKREAKTKLYAKADKSFSLEFVEQFSVERQQRSSASINSEPQGLPGKQETRATNVNFRENLFFRFSSPLTGSQLYYIDRNVSFPSIKDQQPTRADSIKELEARFGLASLSGSCAVAGAPVSPAKRFMLYFFKGNQRLETDFLKFQQVDFPTSLAEIQLAILPFVGKGQNALRMPLGWTLCDWPSSRSQDKNYIEFLVEEFRVDKILIVSLIAGESDDYVGKLGISLLDLSLLNRMKIADQSAIDKSYDSRPVATGIRPPL